MTAIVWQANVLLNREVDPDLGDICAEVFNERIAIVSGVAVVR